jgi:hypothetical protein
VNSSVLDNIAGALIGGAMAHQLFRAKVHIGYEKLSDKALADVLVFVLKRFQRCTPAGKICRLILKVFYFGKAASVEAEKEKSEKLNKQDSREPWKKGQQLRAEYGRNAKRVDIHFPNTGGKAGAVVCQQSNAKNRR